MTPKRETTRSAQLGADLVHRGVGERETRRQTGLGALEGARQHGLGNVEAQNLAAGRDALREFDRRRAAAAADVDHPLARLRVRRCYKLVGNRLEHLVLVVLTVPPAPPGYAVPVVRLGCVAGMDRRLGHFEAFHAGEARGLPFSTT